MDADGIYWRGFLFAVYRRGYIDITSDDRIKPGSSLQQQTVDYILYVTPCMFTHESW
jgi:hypothetical protein